MTLPRCLLTGVTLLSLSIAEVANVEAQRARGSITIDRIAALKLPSSPAWSPDGKRIAFLWDSAGSQNLFAVTPGQHPVALTDFPIDPVMLLSDISSFAWVSADRIFFGRYGQLWEVSPASAKPTLVSGLEDAGNFSLSNDRRQIGFIRDGQIWIAATSGDWKAPRQLTFLPEGMAASAPIFSPDDKYVAFQATRSTFSSLPMPYNGNLIQQFRPQTQERRFGIGSLYGGDPVWIQAAGDVSWIQWTADGSVLYQELSPDFAYRHIKIASTDGAIRTLWKDYEPNGGFSPRPKDSKTVVSPDGKWVVFVSDRSGWMHLYLLPTNAASESQARELTSGNHMAGVAFGAWSPDSRRLAYHHSVDGNHQERFIDILDVATGRSESIVPTKGVSIDPMFSPDGATLLFQRTSVEHSLDLFTVSARAGAGIIRLSESMPAGLLASDLTPPVPVTFPSRVDGKPVPATLMVSKNVDRARKNPAIVWLHGSGPEQNFLGWHPITTYWMYYSANQYLAQQGYVILNVDYRGSSGYSRDWATGSNRDYGQGETLDVASGADYLKTLSFVDPERIGVWGLSYGGFMTLQSMWVTPTLFRAAIEVAGVTNWETYNRELPSNHKGRMGMPSSNPEGYNRMNPTAHMDRLARPLLIMQGTNDNVPFAGTLELVDALLKQGKQFEVAIYPGEIHAFRRGHVLRDAWRRAEDFFDRNLRNAEPPTNQYD